MEVDSGPGETRIFSASLSVKSVFPELQIRRMSLFALGQAKACVIEDFNVD